MKGLTFKPKRKGLDEKIFEDVFVFDVVVVHSRFSFLWK